MYCEFPLGRPLGVPRDADFQHRVLQAALDLLSEPTAPVMAVFPDVVRDEVEQPLACPLPPADSDLPAAVAEAGALRPAWERARRSTGHTDLGRAIDVDQVPAAVAAFVRIAEGVNLSEAGLPGDLTSVAMDVRVYYEEAAVGLSDHVPAARAAESWYYRSTTTGQLMLKVLEVLSADPEIDRRLLNYLVPMSQQSMVPHWRKRPAP